MHFSTLLALLAAGGAAGSIITAVPVLKDGCAWLRKKLWRRRRYHGRHVKPGRGQRRPRHDAGEKTIRYALDTNACTFRLGLILFVAVPCLAAAVAVLIHHMPLRGRVIRAAVIETTRPGHQLAGLCHPAARGHPAARSEAVLDWPGPDALAAAVFLAILMLAVRCRRAVPRSRSLCGGQRLPQADPAPSRR